MRRFALPISLLVALTGLPVAAEDGWQPLSGPEVATALTGRALVYESGATQDFRASGRTLYVQGRDSWGYWAVQGDQYCSMWPPSDLWACYDIARRGDYIRFIDAGGHITDGRYTN